MLSPLHALVVATFVVQPLRAAVPSLQDTPLEPVLATAGEDALIDCVVKDQGNYTVLWRRVTEDDKGSVLAAGAIKVAADPRIAVLHNADHNNWVLRISKAVASDSGRYTCEINTTPPQKITRLLTVVDDGNPTPFLLTHNYTECCSERGIPVECFGYCTLQGIVSGRHNSPRTCLEYIGMLTQCLTDGRNHMPCCVEQKIPETCRAVCVGDYSLSTVAEHYTCMDYTMTTLACIANGVELLPGPPTEVEVEPLSPTELLIKWSRPRQKIDITHFRINVTELDSFDPVAMRKKNDSAFRDEMETVGTMQAFSVKVDANQTSFHLRGLKPVTMYEVTVTSENIHGTSLPSFALRTLTLNTDAPIVPVSNATSNDSDKVLPKLPDIRSCCVKNGVKQERCLRTMCDPSRADETTLTDVMICAPWANVTFACMADGSDHTSCCRRRGLPEGCLDFCKGTLMRVDYRHFRCLEYMPFYGSCLLEHYGVLPGNPRDLIVSSVSKTWAVLKWNPPKKLPETVIKYALYYRRLGDDYEPYFAVSNVKSPYLMDRLYPGVEYEVFVAAENKYGTSEGSERVVFMTKEVIAEPPTNSTGYNETACCVNAGLKDLCMPLCSYKMKLTDLQYLSPLCIDDMHALLRCGSGGRDHRPCCQRYGVKEECLPICAGSLSLNRYDLTALICSRDLGAVLLCMQEEKDIIPTPPQEFHLTFVTPTSVHLVWIPPSNNVSVTQYQIRYEEANGSVPPHPEEYSKVVNVTTSMTIVDKLNPKTRYSFYVVAMNEQGSSMPSLILVVTTPDKGVDDKNIQSTISSPYGLEVTHSSVSHIALKWLPPLHVPADANISYMVRFSAVNTTNHTSTEWLPITTKFTEILINNLTFNTQYAFTVTAVANNMTSMPSEVALAWTDAAIPAFVNLPLVIPAGPIMEGVNMTVMCISVGVPTPTVSVYVNGVLMAQLPQHHIAVTVPRVSRNVTKVSCFASNGYGHGAHSSMDIHVIASPHIVVPLKKVFYESGATARLACEVSGHPEPRLLWFRDTAMREPLGPTERLELQSMPDPLLLHNYVTYLLIHNVSKQDAGPYYCSAENHHGKMSNYVDLTVMDRTARNTSGCCKEAGVSRYCMSACSFDIDIQFAINRPQCIQDLDKLMHCAADGSDHRKCCRNKKVPSSCLHWCVGRSVIQASQCALAAAKEIVSCFEEGKVMLPGPPQNVRVTRLSPNSVEVHWDPPIKNPDSVQWYRIIWRTVGSQALNRNQTNGAVFQLGDLQEGLIYEIAIKAGNHYGLSAHSPPVIVQTTGAVYASASGLNVGARIAIGLIVTALLLVLVAVLAVFYWKQWRRRAPASGVSFENPTYLKDGVIMQNVEGDSQSKPVESTENGHRNGRPRAIENCYEDIRTVRIS